MLKIQEIREIIRLVDESSISEFSYEHENSQVTIKKEKAPIAVTDVVPTPANVTPQKPASVPVAPATETPAEEDAAVKEEKPQEADENITEIVSPMVGTFYRKPTPDSDNYVELSDQVKHDSVVCIVEAMKLFNEIEAETTGEVIEILVTDGELVEYGQPLFKVKTK